MEEVAYGRGYKSGYMKGVKDIYEKASQWLKDRVNIPYTVETNEDGEPLADSYIDYAKKRLEAAEEIISEFKKAMEE
jgi:lysozyme family protein